MSDIPKTNECKDLYDTTIREESLTLGTRTECEDDDMVKLTVGKVVQKFQPSLR